MVSLWEEDIEQNYYLALFDQIAVLRIVPCRSGAAVEKVIIVSKNTAETIETMDLFVCRCFSYKQQDKEISRFASS
jgi:hypothetical protein